MKTIRYVGKASGMVEGSDWHAPENWEGGKVPTCEDDVVLPLIDELSWQADSINASCDQKPCCNNLCFFSQKIHVEMKPYFRIIEARIVWVTPLSEMFDRSVHQTKTPMFTFQDFDSGMPAELIGDGNDINLTEKNIRPYIEQALEDLKDGSDGDYKTLRIVRKDMTEEEVEALPDI